MDERQLARYLSVGRIAVGLGGVLAPGRTAGSFGGASATDPAARFLTRSRGIRDAALGALTIRAADRGDDMGALLWTGVVCDAVDAAAALLAYRHLRPRMRALVVLSALGAAAVGAKLASAASR